MERGLIAVDEWNCKREAYFLTHLHADHSKGLSSKWRRGRLYCSSITASLLLVKFPAFDKTLIHILEVGTTSLISLNSVEFLLEVTPIEAHHCPGAVMYLFRGESGCELYTGDFRWEVHTLSSGTGKEQLLCALGGDKIVCLHLDNTFCNPRFEFPPRSVAAQQVMNIISLYPEHDIVIGVDTLGKEELLLHIASTLKTKIWVRPERLQTMHLLGLPDVFTIDASVTRVRAVPRYSLTLQTLDVLNSMHPTIGILPTGSSFLFRSFSTQGSFCENDYLNSAYGKIERSCDNFIGGEVANKDTRLLKNCNLESSENPVTSVCGKMYLVPYSLHCCFSEIRSFIEVIRPSRLTGIVASSTYDINPNIYFSHLCNGKESHMWNEVRADPERISVERDIV
ncbi:hypothetical protein KI387_018273, partial [Taxus chinensis]